MFQTLFILILTLVAIFLGILLISWRVAKREGTSVAEEFVGICSVTFERSTKKEANKLRILDFLEKKSGEAGNQEIREYLDVSRQSVVRYMNELEKEGKVRQVGEAGRSVIYRLI